MYEEVRSQMKFGDLISFSGKGDISNIIKWKTKSDISHVGIVFESELIQGQKRIVLIESTTLVNIPDIRTKELIKGVQQQHLSQRLDGYNGQAYWHKLNVDISESDKADMYAWLFNKHASRTPYDAVQALGAGMDLFDRLGFENKPDFSSLFCSELVCRVLQIGGVINSELNASEQTPADVTRYNCYDERVQIATEDDSVVAHVA